MFSIPKKNFTSPASLARFLLTAAILLGADLWTKKLAFERLARHDSQGHLVFDADGQVVAKAPCREPYLEPYQVIPGWLHFTVTTNRGAVFGSFEGFIAAFVVVSIAAVLFLGYLFAWSDRQRFYQFILGMLLAGVLGNLYDRLTFGYVRDMVKILPKWKVFPWVFNVADTLLCTGVALMLLYSLIYPGEKAKPAAAETAGDARD